MRHKKDKKRKIIKKFSKKTNLLINKKLKLYSREFKKNLRFNLKSIFFLLTGIIGVALILLSIFKEQSLKTVTYQNSNFSLNYNSEKWHFEATGILVHEIIPGCNFILKDINRNIPSAWQKTEKTAMINKKTYKIITYQEKNREVPWLIDYQIVSKSNLTFRLATVGLFLIDNPKNFQQCKNDAEKILTTLGIKI